MTQTPSRKLVFNQFVRQSSRLLLISLGVTIFYGLWAIQQNNVNRLDTKIISLKNSIDLAEEESKKGNARDQSFTVEKKLSLEKDILLIEKDKATIQNGVYTTLVQALGGLILSITAYVGYCNFRIGEKNLKVTEDKQVTERFSKSIEHLGSEKIDIRLGGIYALEQIAFDSSKYHWTIVEILSAFVREKCQIDNIDMALEKRAGIDIQAAITVICRRKVEQDPEYNQINLRQIALQKVEMSSANLRHVDLRFSDLSGADLNDANLFFARLESVNFSKADLIETNLNCARLEGANFSNANLSNATLIRTDLKDVNLNNTNLSCTDLNISDLSKSIMLTQKQLDTAIIGKHTKLPDHLKPRP